jgi:transcriptional regulator with XRE-family HTH domain
MTSIKKTQLAIKANLSKWRTAVPALETKEKIAARTGVSARTVFSMLTGEDKNFTLKNLASVAEAFGREPWEILIEAAPERLDLIKLVVGMNEDQAYRLKHLIMAIMGGGIDKPPAQRTLHEPGNDYDKP